MPNGACDDIIAYHWPAKFLLQSNGMVAIKPPFSFLTAYDINTGKQIWRIPNGEILRLEEKGSLAWARKRRVADPSPRRADCCWGTAIDRAFRARDADTARSCGSIASLLLPRPLPQSTR